MRGMQWRVEGSEDNHFSCGVAWILSIWVEAAAVVRAQETVTAASPAVISRRWGLGEPSVGEGLVVGGVEHTGCAGRVVCWVSAD